MQLISAHTRPKQEAILIVVLASLPFLVRALTIALGVEGLGGQFAYKILLIGCPLWWRYREGHRGFSIIWPFDESLPSRNLILSSAFIGLFLAGGAILALTILQPYLQIEPEEIRRGLDQRFSIPLMLMVPVSVFLATANAAMEELHFRAWLDRGLSARLSNIVGIVFSAFAFAALHGPIFFGFPGVSFFVIVLIVGALMIAGVAWSLITRRQGGIHAALISHSIADVLLLGWGLSWLGYF